MNIIIFLCQAKYFLVTLLIGLILFLLLISLISVPGNKKINSIYGDQKEKIKRMRVIELILKIILIILICLTVVIIISNTLY